MKNSVNIDELVKKAAKEAAREAIIQHDQEQRDRRFHNTRILMKNYNKLKDHVDNVRDNYRYDEFFDYDDVDDKVWLTSIARTKLRTMQMLAYVDNALMLIKSKMESESIGYKYRAFELHYIEERTNEEISNMLGCGPNQPKRWSDSVLDELSVYLWGVEALGL